MKKLLIMGLPGVGKTTLATVLAKRLNAVHFNADAVRANINRDLGFAEADRIEHARRMGWLCDRVTATGAFAIADFICPTRATRAAFEAGGPALIVWVNRNVPARFADTAALFEPPHHEALITISEIGGPEYWSERIAARVEAEFDPRKPTALFVGRYQPFHDGHAALITEGINRVGQGCIAVRDTHGIDTANPFSFAYVRARIEERLHALRGRFVVTLLPNVTSIFYGREVGYSIERIDIDAELQAISATQVRSARRAT
jgi:adenylylsulfate kinase